MSGPVRGRLCRQDGAVGPVRLGPGDLTSEQRDFVTENYDLGVLGSLAAPQQHQPAKDSDHDQVEQAKDTNRDPAATSSSGQTPAHSTHGEF